MWCSVVVYVLDQEKMFGLVRWFVVDLDVFSDISLGIVMFVFIQSRSYLLLVFNLRKISITRQTIQQKKFY